MIEIVIAVVHVAMGVLFLIYPRQIGSAFCRFGKAVWRTCTLGLADMGRFYPEEKAPAIFRMAGILFIIGGLMWGAIAIASNSGPGPFAAMKQSKVYLQAQYGAADSCDLSTNSSSSPDGHYLVTYRYGTHEGVLQATWQGDRYVFSEEKKR